nr:MAG TPA: adenine-specific methyltransferase [Bacteriophage sp.]
MAKNTDLNKAAKAKKDEFYTQLSDIEKELSNYRAYFKGKSVFCNCDDPYESSFFKYFAMNFNALQLKKLVATCYQSSPVRGTELAYFEDAGGQMGFASFVDTGTSSGKVSRKSYKIEISEVRDENKDGRIDLADVEYLIANKKNTLTPLDGDGDFRSPECVALLQEADVVVTNPPFSLFREFIAQLVAYGKDFLIIGNINAITYKEVFPLIMQNKLWLGASIHSGDREFRVPDSYPLNASGCRVDDNGTKYIRVKGVRWFTNIDYDARHEDLILYKHYTPEEYPRYDNYDAIEVGKTAEIPCDYFEYMGVPITYMDKYNPDQFEIIGADYEVAEPVVLYHGKRGTGRFYLEERIDKNVVKAHTSTDRPTDRPTESCGDYTVALSFVERCNGIMGVPISFLDKYNPDQFEIVGASESEGKGFSHGLWSPASGVAQPMLHGERKYKRLFIRYRM